MRITPSRDLTVLDTLKKVTKAIDPNAFIAGGYASRTLLHIDKGISDVDIYFKSDTFDPFSNNFLSNAFPMLEALFGAYICSFEPYYYHKSIIRIAQKRINGVNFDFIQYSKDLECYNVLDGFDLDESKAAAFISGDSLLLEAPPEFWKAWERPEVKPHLNMFSHQPTNEIQNAKTEKRRVKWQKIKDEYLGISGKSEPEATLHSQKQS